MAKKIPHNSGKKSNPALKQAKIEATLKNKLETIKSDVTLHTVMAYSIMSSMVLYDKFNFSIEDLKKYSNFIMSEADSMLLGYVTVNDMVEELQNLGYTMTKDDLVSVFPTLAPYLSKDKK